jgi:polysaccharide biosynthesis protein PslG
VLFQSRYPTGAVDRALASAARAGLGLGRVAPLWELTEPRPPRRGHHRYSWSYDDTIAQDLSAHGFKWVAVLAFAPGWASQSPHRLHGAPRTAADFAAYAAAVARRYRGLITAFEIWNEENSAAFWRPRPDPAAYANLYLTARRAIRRVDPRAPVLIGGLADGNAGFLTRVLSGPGMRGHVDGVAVHPYASNPFGVLALVRAYRRRLAAGGAGRVALYVTEYGWATRPRGSRTYAPPSVQGPWIAQTAEALLDSDCDVRMAVFYAWVTARRDPRSVDEWYGVASPGGGTSPATAALARASRGLLSTRPARRVALCAAR